MDYWFRVLFYEMVMKFLVIYFVEIRIGLLLIVIIEDLVSNFDIFCVS